MTVIGADTHKSTHTFAAVAADIGRIVASKAVAADRVIRVAPKLMGQTRRGERRPGKSDEIDAVAIARAAVREGVENLPNAFLDEQAFEIRLLHDHRQDLVAERTRDQNHDGLEIRATDADP